MRSALLSNSIGWKWLIGLRRFQGLGCATAPTAAAALVAGQRATNIDDIDCLRWCFKAALVAIHGVRCGAAIHAGGAIDTEARRLAGFRVEGHLHAGGAHGLAKAGVVVRGGAAAARQLGSCGQGKQDGAFGHGGPPVQVGGFRGAGRSTEGSAGACGGSSCGVAAGTGACTGAAVVAGMAAAGAV